jgi:pyruvate-ferredoxin/flavodoxin oxidoreductase
MPRRSSAGQWLLYRYDPRKIAAGENPLHLDSAPPKSRVSDYLNLENRFKMLGKTHPERARALYDQAQRDVDARWQLYQRLAASHNGNLTSKPEAP